MNVETARDLMLAVFKNAWNPLHPVAWDDLLASPPATAIPWARVTVKHATGRQSTLAGETGTRNFTKTGTVIIQIFSPVGEGLKQGYQLAQTVVNAYQDARLGVWFRNTHMKEIGASGAFEQINVLTDFSYDDVR